MAEKIKAPRGSKLSCKGWVQEAAMRRSPCAILTTLRCWSFPSSRVLHDPARDAILTSRLVYEIPRAHLS
jgi:hypothetical protein